MAIRVIVELPVKPDSRAEAMRVLKRVAEEYGPSQPGYLGTKRYEVLDNPGMVIEIADWESAEARDAAMKAAFASGAYAPLEAMLAAPFRATVIRQLP